MLCHKCYNGHYRKYPSVLCSSHQETLPTFDLPEEIIDEMNEVWAAHIKISFLKKCIEDKESPSKINEYIKRWHQSKDCKFDLPTFLGMNLREYEAWVNRSKGVEEIVKDRKEYLALVGKLKD